MGLFKVCGLCRLTRDAELRYSQDGKPILKMGIVTSEKFGDKESQCFLDATVFGKQAEIINQYAGEKGTQIFLIGKLQTESWVDDSGQKRSKQSMIVEGFDFVSKPKGEQNTGANAPVSYEKKKYPESNLPDIDVGSLEIPF